MLCRAYIRSMSTASSLQNPVCAVCGKTIQGRYIRDYWGNNYHSTHEQTHPACHYCGRLISKHSTGGGSRYSDGRMICALCRDRAIENKESGLAVLNEAHDLLEKHGILLRPFRPKFSLLDRQTLGKYSKSGNELGFTHATRRTDSSGRILDLKIQVFILHGLPYEAFLATAAHELMHAWIHLNGRQDAARWFKEGSCNMAAYLALRSKRTLEADYQIEQMRRQTDRVYGRGFRKVLRFAQRRGTGAWLKSVRTAKRLPLL
ncbi:MAG: protein DA1 [Spirochaetia bacterium]|nr:protein DA1 [Spirochaetia bacterium]